MLRLNDEQLAQIKSAAAPIPARLRPDYLQRVSTLLHGRAGNHAEVQRACTRVVAAAARQLSPAADIAP